MKNKNDEWLCGRFVVLVAFNIRLKRMLPFINLHFATPGKINVSVSPPLHEELHCNLSRCVGKHRGLLLTRIKMRFWDDLIDATTTYTELSADEYENPPDIPTIKINRIRAGEHVLLGLPMQQR